MAPTSSIVRVVLVLLVGLACAETGTLRYTLSTVLNDGEPATILGLRPIPGGGTTGAR